MKRFMSPLPIQTDKIVGFIRIVLGALLIFHGVEVFNPEIMNGYLQWDIFKTPSSKFMVYAGKTSEFVAGMLFFFGFLTRIASVIVIATFSYITFFVGQGRFWYEEQHPFMFLLFGILFLFVGPGAWSLDRLVFKSVLPPQR